MQLSTDWTAAGAVRQVDADFCRACLPKRAANAHKGDFGHTLVIGGSAGMFGAPLLSALAAFSVGSGLVTVAAPPQTLAAVTVRLPEAMTLPQEQAVTHLKGKNVVLGMGLGREAAAADLVQQVLQQAEKPLVLDADGLYHLAVWGENKAAAPLIITPHVGEAARLLQCNVAEIENDRQAAALELARRYHAIAVLKGAGTLTATPHGELFLNSCGNVGMATAGSGDVLAGVIGGLLAGGLNALNAAVCGVYLHASAGDLAAERYGIYGMRAGGIVEHLPTVLLRLC